MVNFLHTYNPKPVLFQWGFFQIHWYGLFIVLGILVALVVALNLAKKLGKKSDEIFDLSFYVIIFGLLGARAYAVFLDWPYYFSNPFEIIAVWHGGLAIHGAVLGGAATALVYCFFKKQSFWFWADLAAPAVALGQALGRLGNYFNQEVFGRPTNLPWGIPINLDNRPFDYLAYQYFHPTFLYELVLNLFNFGILIFLFSWIRGNRKINLTGQGIIFLFYLINYSFIRIVMEFLRVDQTPIIFGLRLPIIVSLIILLFSLIIICFKVFRSGQKNLLT